jgi:hypothetical protein
MTFQNLIKYIKITQVIIKIYNIIKLMIYLKRINIFKKLI